MREKGKIGENDMDFYGCRDYDAEVFRGGKNVLSFNLYIYIYIYDCCIHYQETMYLVFHVQHSCKCNITRPPDYLSQNLHHFSLAYLGTSNLV